MWITSSRTGAEHFSHVGEKRRDTKALRELLRHQHFPITNRRDLAIRNAMDGMHMLVRDLPAAYDSNPKHRLIVRFELLEE